MKQDLSNKRKDYTLKKLDFKTIPNRPLALFKEWYEEVTESGLIREPYAASLSAVRQDGFPRTRVVLLREFNDDGFIFYTNYHSTKGKSIENNPKVSFSFFWDKLERQVIILGEAKKIEAEKSDVYFQKRPRKSQIGAWVSQQSSKIDFDEDLEKESEEQEKRFEGREVPRPAHWGGYIIEPVEIEFWQGRSGRLHDRILYKKVEGNWEKYRLAP